jgi:hypothetical protein
LDAKLNEIFDMAIIIIVIVIISRGLLSAGRTTTHYGRLRKRTSH